MSLVSDLMSSLQILPGVGPKTAQRLTFHLLQKDQAGGKNLAETLLEALEKVGECEVCRTLTENQQCKICTNSQRKYHKICVVETPADIIHIEAATDFSGKYFVLHGKLSPIDGMGPADLKLNMLVDMLAKPECEELIIATGSTLEGETTAQYLAHLAEQGGIKATRLAHGVPLGGDLEYIDNSTLAHAFASRTNI
ncbi:recombination mediator RecR [Marinicella sp. S1101]|uniref:recombination mediator RecR n=1 Tax=Marinicella marina TaxID=2996016 RepID=UPI002260B3F2|nr:recombination mediator RecR [Marinicella marina]MCX7554990.1 recombination mediator RecR [Marinicella marina]MDJ1141346.1 recombination mediator RecR [Marinicella marina]